MRHHPVTVIFRKEWREILRDRRAIFTAIILPVLTYPLLLFVTGSLTTSQVKKIRAERLRVGLHDPDSLLAPRLEADSTLEVVDSGSDSALVRSGKLAAILVLPDSLPAGSVPEAVLLSFQAREASMEARMRLERHLEAFRREERQRRFEAAGGRLPLDSLVVVRVRDVATQEEASGARMGELLPFLLVVILVAGSAFAALDLIPGEKERGTLETLFLSPVPAVHVAWGKILVVVSVGILAGILNLAGMAGSAALGLGGLFGASFRFALSPLSLLQGLLLVLPLAVLVSGILMIVVSSARSYKEASTYLTPVMLLLFVPLFLAMGPGTRLDPLLALLPVANAVIAFRESLAGTLRPALLVLTFASTALYAAAAVRVVARLLQREEIVLGPAAAPSPVTASGRPTVGVRQTLLFAAGVILLVYYAGQFVQSRSPLAGLAVTLWVLVLGPALLFARRARGGLRAGLALRHPGILPLAGAVLLAPGLALAIQGWVVLQDLFMPAPRSLVEQFERLFGGQGIGAWTQILLFSLSPGICEELFFRGAVQQALAPRLGRPTVILITALLFGATHLSIYRFVPTALAGAVFSWIVFRTGSVLPAVLLHAAYNAVGLFGGSLLAVAQGAPAWVWATAALAAVLGLRFLGRGRAGNGDGAGAPDRPEGDRGPDPGAPPNPL
jgi:sodium transport system permease protein